MVQWLAVLEWARRRQREGQDVSFVFDGVAWCFRYAEVLAAARLV